MFLDLSKRYSFNRVACYIRRSRADEEREKRTGEDTLTGQRLYMEDLLKRMGIEYDLFQEIASGSTIEGRKVFKELLRLVGEGKYDGIAVKEISRITRGNYEDLAKIEKSFKRNRIKILTDYSILDLQNPDDEATFDTQLYFSRSEYKRTTHRMVSARKAFAMVGKWQTGSVPYGYQINRSTGKLEPVKERAEIIKYIFGLYVYGIDGSDVGFRAISNHLKRQGIKSPRGTDKWDPSALKNIVSNPAYKGDVRYNKTEMQDGKKIKRPDEEHIYVENVHEPIIDPEVWEMANAKLTSPTVIVPRNRNIEVSILTGLVRCFKCNKHMYKSSQPRRRTRKDGSISESVSISLRCRTMGCTCIQYNIVEQQVVQALEHLKDLDDNALNHYLKGTIEYEHKYDLLEEQRKELEIQKLTETLTKLGRRKERIQELYEDGDYTRDEYIERRNAINEEITRLQKIEQEFIRSDEETAVTESNINITQARKNITRIVDLLGILETGEEKNRLLGKILYYIRINRIEKGAHKKPPKFEMELVFKEAVIEV